MPTLFEAEYERRHIEIRHEQAKLTDGEDEFFSSERAFAEAHLSTGEGRDEAVNYTSMEAVRTRIRNDFGGKLPPLP